MDGPAFKRSAKRVLRLLGFQWVGHSFERQDSDVCTWSISRRVPATSGSSTLAFGSTDSTVMSDRVEKTHLYFRLERLVPEHFETIRTAGELDEQNSPEPARRCGNWPVSSTPSSGRWDRGRTSQSDGGRPA